MRIKLARFTTGSPPKQANIDVWHLLLPPVDP
jgi:hypothetical protein